MQNAADRRSGWLRPRQVRALSLVTESLRCGRHQESTRLRCVECEAPICPRCLVRTEVGMRCEECAQPAVPAPPVVSRRSHLPGAPLAAAVVGALLIAAVVVVVLSRRSGPDQEGVGAPVGTWSDTPPLTTIRGTATLVVLGDGRALVAGGGVGGIALAATEVFDPGTATWRSVAPMTQIRRGHQAALLKDGRVLVAGGLAEGSPLASAEIYDPASERWTVTGAMSSPRLGSSLTTLADGRVLAAGGTGSSGGSLAPVSSAEIFDPASGTWAPSAAMTSPRFEHTATLLEDGRVLLVGGLGPGSPEPTPLASSEMFDPAAGSFVRSSDLAVARANHAAVALSDHRVMVAGGAGRDGAVASVEVFDPPRGTWTPAGGLAQARAGETASVLPDGRVLVAGGESVEQGARRALATAEITDPQGGSWRSAGQMRCPRSEAAAAVLGDGSVLVVAGDAAFPGQAPQAQGCADRYQTAATRPR